MPGPAERRPRVNLRKLMFVLPNLFTVSSIFCGIYSITLCTGDAASGDQFFRAAIAIFFGNFFDAFDGRVARMTKTQSEFGVELDSLADVITFGVAPAILVYKWALASMGMLGMAICATYAACGAIRNWVRCTTMCCVPLLLSSRWERSRIEPQNTASIPSGSREAVVMRCPRMSLDLTGRCSILPDCEQSSAGTTACEICCGVTLPPTCLTSASTESLATTRGRLRFWLRWNGSSVMD